MGDLLHRFISDDLVQALVFLMIVDLALGVGAALKTGKFRLTYLADFARGDGVKVVFLLVLYGVGVFAGDHDILIPGLDALVVAQGAIIAMNAGLAASILNSVRDLGLVKLPDAVAGDDPATPGAPPPA